MGSMGKHAWLVFGTILAASTSAAAQDFSVDWIDRVSQQLTAERGPLEARPWEIHVTGGVEYYFDDNIFLSEDDEVDDSIVIPFVRATLNYSEQRFELSADLLANYKFYVDENDGDSDLSDDEERLYLRGRQASNRYSLELVQILQRVSDPIGVVFADRAERVVSNTIPRVEFDFNREWAFEVDVNYQILRYDDSDIGRAIDNDATRATGSLVYRTSRGYDLVGQFGWQDIAYDGSQSEGAPPDAFGWFARVGIRGELLQRLFAEAYVGFDHIESDYFQGTSVDQEDNTTGAFVNLRYEFTETVRATAEYSRQFTFAGGGDPYQRVDRILANLDLDVNPRVGFKLRGQYDHASTALSDERIYMSGGASGWVKPIAWMILDAGVTFRSGESEDQSGSFDTEYDNLIFHVGLAASY
jgi:hypothetical protein